MQVTVMNVLNSYTQAPCNHVTRNHVCRVVSREAKRLDLPEAKQSPTEPSRGVYSNIL